jgi:FKBP-type peptidyl-prolyl cis-trans isomerase
MKKLTILLIALAFALFGCKKDNSSGQKNNFDNDTSYALGMDLGEDLRERMTASGIYPDMEQFIKGFTESIRGKKTRFDITEARALIEAALNKIAQEMAEEAIKNANAFMAENSRKPGIRITPSGVQYEVITESNERKPSIEDRVFVHYEGSLSDGQVFDSSYNYGAPIDFQLSTLIPGWAEGIQLMGVGSKYKFYIPWEQAYGPEGFTHPYTQEVIIPPYSTLIFVVELLDIL